MNRWKILTLMVVLLSLGLLVYQSVTQDTPWVQTRSWMSEWAERRQLHPNVTFSQPVSLLAALFSLYLSGVLLLFTFPGQVKRVSQALAVNFTGLLRLLLLGMLMNVLVVSAGVLASFSMATFPLTILLVMALFFGSLMGTISLAYRIGRLLLQRSNWMQTSPLGALLLGILIVYGSMNIPYIGMVLLAIISSLGLGAAVSTRFGTGRPWSLNSLIEEGKE